MTFKRMLCVAVILVGFAQLAVAKQYAMEDFFKSSQFAGFQLSPNGKHLAALAPLEPANNRMNIVIFDLQDRSQPPSFITNVDHQDIFGITWANNERLLFYMDKDGSESLGIFAVNADGSMPRTLVEPAESQVKGGNRVIRYANVIDTLRDDPDHVLVVSNERRATSPDVFRMNIMNGRQRLVQRNPGNIQGWVTDWEGNLWGAGFTEGTESGFMLFDPETEELTEIVRTRFDEYGWGPALLTGDGETGYVTSNVTPDGKPRDKAALYEYNFETGEFGDLVYESDKADCCGVMTTWAQKDLIGVSYMYDKPEMVWLDEKWKAAMAGIDEALPDTVNAPSSVTDDESLAVIASYSDKQPATYYLYDFNTRTLELLAESRPWIDPADMAEIRPVVYKARDGKEIPAYLTLPPGADGKDLPLIVNPHGGPEARDGWGYNPEVQFLANRGYAVLQPQFRGSTGFGMDHWKAHFKQWGQAMQNDITDGVQWAIEEGIADPERVCIYGASYGGYAAMAGLVYTPDLYACGVNYVGVTDLHVLYETMPDVWEPFQERQFQTIGNPETEGEFLEQWSPSNHADKIKAPLFMAYGRQDPRVDIEHAEVMIDAMKDADVEYEYMVKGDEGHGYRKEENRFEFYGKLEQFFAEHIGGEQASDEPPASP